MWLAMASEHIYYGHSEYIIVLLYSHEYKSCDVMTNDAIWVGNLIVKILIPCYGS